MQQRACARVLRVTRPRERPRGPHLRKCGRARRPRKPSIPKRGVRLALVGYLCTRRARFAMVLRAKILLRARSIISNAEGLLAREAAAGGAEGSSADGVPHEERRE